MVRKEKSCSVFWGQRVGTLQSCTRRTLAKSSRGWKGCKLQACLALYTSRWLQSPTAVLRRLHVKPVPEHTEAGRWARSGGKQEIKAFFRGTNEAFCRILLLRRKTTLLKETLSTTKTSCFKRTIDRCLGKHMKNSKLHFLKGSIWAVKIK